MLTKNTKDHSTAGLLARATMDFVDLTPVYVQHQFLQHRRISSHTVRLQFPAGGDYTICTLVFFQLAPSR